MGILMIQAYRMFLEEKLLLTRYNLRILNVESKDLSYELATFFVLWKSIL